MEERQHFNEETEMEYCTFIALKKFQLVIVLKEPRSLECLQVIVPVASSSKEHPRNSLLPEEEIPLPFYDKSCSILRANRSFAI